MSFTLIDGGKRRLYEDEQIERMSLQELKSLKALIQQNMEDIAYKRSKYQNENTERRNSHGYWTRINNYKSANMAMRLAQTTVEKVYRRLLDSKDTDEKKWLYKFYRLVEQELEPNVFQAFVKNINNSLGYEFGGKEC